MNAVCPRCEKPVFFAERVSSAGRVFHRQCLRCANEHCGRPLAVGNHAEKDGRPFCHRCYGALFGPRGYGRGGVESHVFCNGTTGKA